MSTQEEIWTARLHAAVDDHPDALAFDVTAYVAAGRKRARRNRAVALATTLAAVAVAVVAVAGAAGTRGGTPEPAAPAPPHIPAPANGWVAVDAYQGGGDIYLVRPGEEARRLAVAGSDAANEACPAWSPDGTRLLFGRVTGSSDTKPSNAELVIVPVGQNGAARTPTVIGLNGFEVLDGFDAHPCGAWAPDGRWVAFAGTGEVWVVDTQTGAIRLLPDLRPSDLEWRPGTDELAIAGDMGTNRRAPTLSTPVTIYSVSTGELRQLGAVEAAHITWSPDGTTLAYTGGEADAGELWLVDGDGTNEGLLVADLGEANHGIGPVWSPTGDRIAYQRTCCGSAEGHEVVLVNVADGTETVIKPPKADGVWYPFTVTWSPDGTTLLYAAWSIGGKASSGGVIAVPADMPSDVTVLIDAIDPLPDYYSHRWAPLQMWGRQSG
jgi:Tol biopolymer transport system component